MEKHICSDIEFKNICNTSGSMSQAAARLGMHFNTFKRKAIKLNCYSPNQSGKGLRKNAGKRKISLQDILAGKYPHYQTFKLKNRLLADKIKDKICENCHQRKWMNVEIPLELHHIDGNRCNHTLQNLKILCPNCHALTPTYRAKNI